MVLSFRLTLYWPITPRHRLPVINSLRFRKVAYFPENAVRVFERVSRVMPPLREAADRQLAISAGLSQSHTGINQSDRSPRKWI
jgi:hypothetical protein